MIDHPKKRILVTGGAGYVGSVIVPALLQRGYAVRVLDHLRWGGSSLLGVMSDPHFEFHAGDLRNPREALPALDDIDAIIHLAAIVGDPACRSEPKLAEETNLTASIQLLELAKEKKVKRFIFASTCSNYGKMSDKNQLCNEDSPLKPVSLYAELKVKFEQHLLSAKNHICVTPLRFATAYGLSSRMRFDLTVNEFAREAACGKELVIYGEKFWRPYCHTNDLARACIQILEAPEGQVHRQPFNVGDDTENYQKVMIVAEILKQAPQLSCRYVHKEEDPRDYRVSFQKIKTLGFTVTKRVPDGIREIVQVIRSGVIPDPYEKKYSNT